MHDIRRDFSQRLEHEASEMQARMWKSEPGRLYDLITHEEQIEVDYPGPVVDDTFPTEPALDVRTPFQYLKGR